MWFPYKNLNNNFRTEQSRPATNLTEKKLQKVEVTGPTTWLQARKVKPGVLLFEKFATGCELRTNFIELYSVPRKLFCLTRSINFDCLLCGYGRHWAPCWKRLRFSPVSCSQGDQTSTHRWRCVLSCRCRLPRVWKGRFFRVRTCSLCSRSDAASACQCRRSRRISKKAQRHWRNWPAWLVWEALAFSSSRQTSDNSTEVSHDGANEQPC